MRLLVLVLWITVLCSGQTTDAGSAPAGETPQPVYKPPPVPGCDAYTIQEIPQLGLKRKACYYRDQLLTGSALFGAGFFAGLAQWEDDPSEWPQGADGFGRRFGVRYAQGMAKSTGSFLFGALDHEDPRQHPPRNPACDDHKHGPKTGFWPRTGDALLRTVWAHRDNCTDNIAFSHFAGALSSGFIGMAWMPARENTVGQAFLRSGEAFGGDVAASVFSEFQGDLFGLVSRMFGRGKAKP